MINKEITLPFYAKASIFFIGLFAFVAILYIAQGIIIPLIFALIIAIILHPVVNFFTRKKINRLAAIIITLLLTVLIIVGFGALIYSQASRLSESWPALVDKFTQMLNQSITWASGYFNINAKEIHGWIADAKEDLINNSGSRIGQTLATVSGWLIISLLVPVYIFMLLFYQPLLIEFIHKLFGTSNQAKVSEIVTQTKSVIQRYLIGLIIEAIIIATLYTIALLTLGIEYAFLLGIIGALLNVIPYVGGLVGVALPMVVALATKASPWYALYIMGIYYFIQLIDNYYIVPKIVASKVKINALFTIIAVIAGNALWGIPGMFLSIPLLAIIKLIFDNIESLNPWGFLLGDTMPPVMKISPSLKKLLKR